MVERNADDAGGILDGIRIIDMSTGIAGPVATMLLAAGAEGACVNLGGDLRVVGRSADAESEAWTI